MKSQSEIQGELLPLRLKKSNLEDCQKSLNKLLGAIGRRKDPGGRGLDDSFDKVKGPDIDYLYELCLNYYQVYETGIIDKIHNNLEVIESNIASLRVKIYNLEGELYNN